MGKHHTLPIPLDKGIQKYTSEEKAVMFFFLVFVFLILYPMVMFTLYLDPAGSVL